MVSACSVSARRGRRRLVACTWFVAARIVAAALLSAVAAAAWAQTIPTYSAHDFAQSVGINTHFGWRQTAYEAEFAVARSALQELRIKQIRQRLAGQLALQRAAELIACCQIKILALIDERSGDGEASVLAPDRIDGALAQVLTLGLSNITAFEGPNEYNGHRRAAHWPAELRAYQAQLYQRAKALTSGQTPVIGPSIWMRQRAAMLAVGDISTIADLGNSHNYTLGRQPSLRIDQDHADLTIMYASRPIWTTEYGFNNALAKSESWPVPEEVAVRYLPIFALELFLRDSHSKNYIYELIDQGRDPAVPQFNWGLMRSDGSKKPAYFAVKSLMGLVDDDVPVAAKPLNLKLAGDIADLRSLALRRSNGSAVLLLWRNQPLWDPRAFTALTPPGGAVTITLPEPATVNVTELAGKPIPPGATKTASLTVTVPSHVIAVEISWAP